MSNRKKEFDKAAEKLRGMKTLAEILDTATAFEESARDFYTELAPKVSKRIRWLVEELAEEEKEHYRLFSELASRTRSSDTIQIKVKTPQSDGKFTDCLHLPDLGKSPDDQEVMLYALGREQAAMEQYRALADSTQPGEIHDLFEFLANEETKHKAELEKQYYELFHS
ncbi:MAG: rubrerythrin [Gammaproteobacteria bacterium]|nr:rubrerythrin [Gammaproteobacteria bacterium]